MKTIKIAGTEHFNLPRHLAIKTGDFENENIDLRTDVPEGTGKMYKCLGWRN
jgi:hypothetical protein